MRKLTSGFFAAALVLALPLTANAQEDVVPQEETQEVCTATIAPIYAGERVAATATFTSPFGKVVEIEAPAESGLALATDERAEMADELGAAGEAEPLAGEENASTFYLNASTPGTHLITLKNEAGETCSAEITVEGEVEAEGVDSDTDW